MDRHAIAAAMVQQGFFRGPLAMAVGVVELGLGRRGKCDRRAAACGGERSAQRFGEAGIASFELGRVRWPVDSGKVKHDIGAFQGFPQLNVGTLARHADHVGVAKFVQPDAQVAADEAIGSGDDDAHAAQSSVMVASLRAMSFMQSSFSRSCFMPSTSSRFVLCEL